MEALNTSIIAIFLLIVIFIVAHRFDRQEKSKKSGDLSPKISPPTTSPYLIEVEQFLSIIEDAKKNYFRFSQKAELKTRFYPLYQTVSGFSSIGSITDPKLKQFIEIYSNLDSNVRTWNEVYCAKEIVAHKELFDNIDGKSLDMAQRKAVVVDEDNTMVVAGAGTGKTLTVSAKVKYLVDKKNVNPDQILLISYTRKAADEMQERITTRLGIDVEVRTFHSLGLNIISRYLGYQPDVLDPDKREMGKLIDKYFEEEVLRDSKVMENLIEFFAYYINIPQDLEKVKNLGEVYEDNRSLDFETLRSKVDMTTISGERVKSLEEVTIANFLYLHGVNYTYEKKYPNDTGDPYRKHYKPDFYLEDYDIYLEHFGINEHGRAPWLSSVEEKKYLNGIRWKRQVHQKNMTTLIETYSYQNKRGQLNVALDRLLQSKGVKYQEVDLKEIYEKVFAQKEDRYFKEFKKLLKTFIELFKSNGYSASDFATLYKKAFQEKNDFLRKRSVLFLFIVKPIYHLYQEYLGETGQIDFNDMINQATELIKSGRVSSDYKYIIVDEYQDISVSRYRLIYELKKQTNAQVVAVGDDWQSIYRFSGSDINLFTDIDNYFGYTEKVKIEKTYRNSQQLIDTSGRFIMMNPEQIKKQLISDKSSQVPISIFGYDKDTVTAVKSAIDLMFSVAETKKEILILGRTNFDINIFNEQEEFEIIKNVKETIIKYDRYPESKITFSTVHKAKGVEAENVIVLNLENTLLGFPNKISDDPVLSLVLTDQDEYEFAEERRLFYVALTRTKNFLILMAYDHNPSLFVDELRRDYNVPYRMSSGVGSIWNYPHCPRCKKGVLVLRTYNTDCSQFLGCSNYPQCDYTVDDIGILNNTLVCNWCGGFMVPKGNGSYRCTNYPFCMNSF